MKLFKQLLIGDVFHTGIRKGVGANKDTNMAMIFVKVSKSQAKCVNQIGYENHRSVGFLYPFGTNSQTWETDRLGTNITGKTE